MWVTYSQEFKETSVNQDPLWSQFHFRRLRRNKHSPKIITGFFPFKTAMLLGFSLLHSWIYNFHLTREACWLFSPCLLSLNWATSKWKYQMESHISMVQVFNFHNSSSDKSAFALHKEFPWSPCQRRHKCKTQRDTIVWRPLFIVRGSSAKILNTGNSNGILGCVTPGTSTVYWFSSVQSLSCVWPFVMLWTAAHQTSLSVTNSQSLLKLMSIELVMPSNHLILSSPSPPTFSLSQHQGLFKWVSTSSLRWPKYLEF